MIGALGKGTTTLDDVHLLLAQGESPETRWQIISVKNLAGRGLDAGHGVGLVGQRTMLLSLLAVLGKRSGERFGRRGGVGSGSVVNRCWR